MLDLLGDILNWTAAGIFFPLLFLPLAVYLGGDGKSTLMWGLVISGVVLGGVLFSWLTPVLSVTPSIMQAAKFAGLALLTISASVLLGGADKLQQKISPFFESIAKGARYSVMWLVLAMAVVQFVIVILRYVFGENYIYMQESITYMHGAVFLLAAGCVLLTDDHVRVDIFYREAPKKRKALVDFLGTYLLLFPVCLLLIWTASPYVANSWAVREGSTETSGIQAVFILKSFIPIFAMLLSIAGFNIAARASAVLRGRD